MMYTEKFVKLIKTSLFYSIIWVIMSFVILAATFIVFIPFILFKSRDYFSACVALYFVLQVFFTSAYAYAIIDSVKTKGGKR